MATVLPEPAPEYEVLLSLAQACISAVPTIVLGSGASCAVGIRGMEPLAGYLQANVTPDASEQEAWQSFSSSLVKTRDLEAALQEVNVPATLLEKIIAATRAMVHEDDYSLFGRLVEGTSALPLAALLTHLFRSAHRSVTVITTNYDRMAEYAANHARQGFEVGFSDGYVRHFLGGTAAARSSRHTPRTVEIWKVHGSVDWFTDHNGVTVALPYTHEYPASLKPLLVTPGVSKYARTHQEPFRTILQKADAGLSNARAFLCIGYGFNDEHIEPKLVQRATSQQVPVVILAKTLRPGAKDFLKKCAHDKVVALEECDDGTRAYTCEHSEGVLLPGVSLWDLTTFLKEIGATS